jgi:AraC-like DNA-binding protein
MKEPACGTSKENKFRSFIQKASSVRLIVFSLGLFILVFFAFFHKKDLVIFPSSQGFNIVFYTDKNDNGFSEILSSSRSDSVIGVRFMLKKGFVLPYVGINFALSDNQYLDVSDYNRMECEVYTENVSDLQFYLVTEESQVKDTSHRLSYRHSSLNVELKDKIQAIALRIRDFSTPDWWYTVIGQPKSDFGSPDYSRLNQLSVTTGLNPKRDVESTLYVYNIRFYRDNTLVLVMMFLGECSFILGLFLVYLVKHKNKRTISVDVRYKPVEIHEKPESGLAFLNYISENFTNPDLGLSLVSKATGVHQRYISDTISENYHCNFKTYVNQIRVNEAKRLLKESDLNIGEIAYSVGFSSPGSFNRVFKSLTGKTPSEFQQDVEK